MESDDLDYRNSPALISTNTDRPRSTVLTISLEYNLDYFLFLGSFFQSNKLIIRMLHNQKL